MSLTIEDLEKQLKEKLIYKEKVSDEYFKVLGQVQLLKEQIFMLKEKEKSDKKEKVDLPIKPE